MIRLMHRDGGVVGGRRLPDERADAPYVPCGRRRSSIFILILSAYSHGQNTPYTMSM